MPVPAEAGTTVQGTGSDTLAFVRPGEVELRDTDGTSRKVALPEDYAVPAAFGSIVTAAKTVAHTDGTRRAVSWHLLSPRPDGTTQDVTVTGPDDGTRVGRILAGDASGLLMWTPVQNDQLRVGVVSTETGRFAELTPEVPRSYSHAKLSPKYIALFNELSTSVNTVLVTSRTAPSTPFTTVDLNNYDSSGTSNHQFAIVGDWLVYKSSRNTLDAVPIAGGPALTLLPKIAGGPSAGPDGTAAVIGGSNSVDWALRRITPDASGKPVVTVVKRLPKPARIKGIALAQGRLSVVDNSEYGDWEWARDISTSGALTFGDRTKLTGIPMDWCAPNDSACAAYRALGDGRFMRRVAADDTNWRYYVNGPGDGDFRDLGLPAGGRIDDVSADYLVHTVPGAPGKQIVITTWGQFLEQRAPVASALWGTWLWSAGTEEGTVTAKDLKAGKTVDSVNTGAPCVPTELQAAGRWLYWSCGEDGPAGVYDRTAKTSRSVPSGEALLGDGYVVTHDKTAGKLVLTGAAADGPASRVVGALPDTGVSQRHVRWSVDRFGGHLAYVDAEEQVHVVPTGVAAQPPAVLGRTPDSPVIKADSGHTLLTRLYSKPVSWTLTARHVRTGLTSELAAGANVRGELSIGWNGRDKAGTLLPNGAYLWTLTARPADGVGAEVQESGSVTLFNGSSSASSRFVAVTPFSGAPARILDTRSGLGARKGRVGAGGSITLQAAGHGHVPATGVTAVALNVAAVLPTASTYVTVHPYGTARPATSSLNVPAGRILANMVVVPVKDGKVTLYNHAGSVDLVADVTGYYTTATSGTLFQPLTPTRIVNSLSGLGVPKGKVQGGIIATAPVLGRGGVPGSGVSAVVLHLTVTNATASTHVSVYGTRFLDSWQHSHVHAAAGRTASNLVVVPMGADLNFHNAFGAVDVLADVVGYYPDGHEGSLFEPLPPTRALNTLSGTGAPKAKVGARGTVTLQVAGRNGVPATGVTAVVMNVTATNATAATYVSVYPYGTSRPNTSNLNVTAGRPVANLVVVPVKDGKVTLYNHAGSVDLLADVQGFYAP
ncbi:VCBS repeat-containing protein [Streptomyces sp. NPDC012769]|uniref:VCBS repeat-containing protein n=1 Tax=Streptomyces sp. NPDC012769 TaxID=3364848 RepID=UPI0036A0134C